MATPVVESFTPATSSTSSAAHTLTMPAGVVAGNLLLVLVSFTSSSSALTVTPTAGWYTCSRSVLTADPTWSYVFWCRATGTDALTLTLSASVACTYAVLHISSANFVAPAVTNATLSATRAPTLEVPYYARDYLYLTAFMTGGDAGAAVTCPSTYTLITGARFSTGTLYIASRTVASQVPVESPGDWTYTYITSVVLTLAVYELPTIAGTILDSAGDPLSTSVHVLYCDTGQRLTWYPTGTNIQPLFVSDAAGNFVIPLEDPFKEYNIWIPSPDPQYADLFFSRIRSDFE